MSQGFVRQVLVGANGHDAITNIALELSSTFGDQTTSAIHSWFEPDSSVSRQVTHISNAGAGNEGDILVYHLSYGIPELTSWLLDRPEKLVIWYHNVTPAAYFEDLQPDFARGLEHGRREIGLLRERSVMAIADSEFNALELKDEGYADVRVASPRLSFDRLSGVEADVGILSEIWTRFPNGYFLVVSQLLPHKRADHAVSMAHLLRKYHQMDVGIVWAGPVGQERYRRAIECFQQRLNEPGVMFLNVVSDGELAALYRGCICLLSFSEHEGLSLPPLEAMANRAPVVVRGSGAVPETVGTGGIVVPPKTGLLEFSELLAHVARDEQLRSSLRVAGERHLRGYGSTSTVSDAGLMILSTCK